MVDFPKNPVTLRDMVPRDASDRILGGDPALKALVEVGGFVPLADRKRGTWKLSSFHVFNALTLGIVGQVGVLCANSQAMGSQKWYAAGLKDFGQTYLNATVGRHAEDVMASPADGRLTDRTFRGEKLLRRMTKAWSEGLGAVTGLPLHPFTMHACKTHRARLGAAFATNFRHEFGRPPSMESAKGMTIDRLVAISRDGKAASLAKAREEYEQILENRPADRKDGGLTVTEIMAGSDNLKTLFAHKLNSEFSLENLMFRDWADGLIRDAAQQTRLPAVPGTLKSDTADYRLSTFELALGHNTLIKTDSDYELNLNHGNRTDWQKLVNQHLTSFRVEWNKLVDRRKLLKRALAKLTPGTPAYRKKLDEIAAAESLMKAKQAETLPPDVSRQFGRALADTYDKIHSLMRDVATRLGNEIAPPPPAASKTTVALDGKYHHADYSDEFRGLVQAHLNADAAKAGAKEAGGTLFSGMENDIGRSTYEFNGTIVSSPRSGVDMDAQVKHFAANAEKAGIPPEHLLKMSLVMHQGMFAVHQLETARDPDKAPLPLLFGDVLDDDHRSDGTSGTTFKIRATNQPGVYDFEAITKKPMNNIQDFSDLENKGMQMQPTDETQSGYVLKLTGKIDCNPAHGAITLSGGTASYRALPQPA